MVGSTLRTMEAWLCKQWSVVSNQSVYYPMDLFASAMELAMSSSSVINVKTVTHKETEQIPGSNWAILWILGMVR
jgi:hypothetical protein